MKLSKLYITLVIVLLNSFLVLSQQRRNHQQNSQRGQQNKMTPAKLKPENMVGILMYDTKKVLKKLKIKSKKERVIVIRLLKKHNNSNREIKVFNQETFTAAKTFLKTKREEAKQHQDFSVFKEARVKVKKMLLPIRKKVTFERNRLNKSMQKVLSEKEYKKWLKYQKKELKNLKPTSKSKKSIHSKRTAKGKKGRERGRH